VNRRNGVGLDWSTFFDLQEDKNKILEQIKKIQPQFYDWDKYDHLLFVDEVSPHDEAHKRACKIVVLRFCLEDTTFAQDVLSEQDYEKCLSTFERKQYDSKLLKDLLNKFCYLLSLRAQSGDKDLKDLLKLDIIRQTNELREKNAEESFLPLKKQIEKVASGVKGICYLAADKPQEFGFHLIRDTVLSPDLNNYLEENFSYDFNSLHRLGNMSLLVLFDNRGEQVNQIMQRALLDNTEFWKTHNKFDIINFIRLICKHNDLRHAEKVLSYIFNVIDKLETGHRIIEKSLPLNFLNHNKFNDGLEERTFRFTFDRFRGEDNLSPILNSGLCFPFTEVENFEDKLFKGKEIANELFTAIYPEEHEKVLKFLNEEIENPAPVFLDEKETIRDVTDSKHNLHLSVQSTEKWTIKSIFDSHTFGYHTNVLDREAVEAYCPEYFSAENIWNRFYLKAYYMSLLVKDKKICFANLFEIFYDLFQFIEKKIGTKTSYQRNTDGRDNAFAQLSAVLKSRDIQTSEDFKEDYIIALLDRKVAIREESERFPVLEQLGDAVYGLAVAELLFYNPNEENIANVYDDFVCAQAQIKVAKKIGTDKLYLSSYSLPRKYERDILIDADTEPYVLEQEREQYSNKQKYIADSLEMIIGTICKDCGYEKAIAFSKRILKETFPEKFNNELHWGEDPNSDIDADYWQRILPSPYSNFDNNQRTLWQAFDKFFKAYVLGTEDPQTRSFITYSLGDKDLYDDYRTNYEVNRVFYEYLHNGLEKAISKFNNSVKENYKKLKR